ncbi:EEIG1/EHBP1 protein amino-terminal domain protein [Thalictrum thalictroides]|uniref:EEIG1/EHBP1 protein amino-terminal domain protein n=1 Tax=Thalictrum thalictroides TaxID=46969 RepID=A0A7J6VT99_THATH|nr:EEIG1/EHBP1 protein amino-terminal domain protein [Thalictrum thalictroides]
MVLGLRSKNRKGPSVQVDYVVNVQEIKPWPPSHSLKSPRSVLLQWENGDRSSGSTKSVVPLLGSGVGDGKIEFNESFRIPVTLSKELSIKGGDSDTFLKNCLEFNLYETRRDKTVKGQHLGTVIVDLAEYGILKENVIISAPMNCKRSFKNTAQPVLFIKLEPFRKRNSRSSSMESLSKEASLDKDGKESVSASINGDNGEEAELESFTDDDDDDASQHSTLTVSSSAFEATGSSPPQSEENALEAEKDSTGSDSCILDVPLEPVAAKPDVNPQTAAPEHVSRSSSHSSSLDSSSEVLSPENDQASLSSFPRISATDSGQSSSSSIAYEEEEVILNNSSRNFESKSMTEKVQEYITTGRSVIEQNAELCMLDKKTSDLESKVAFPDTDTLLDKKACLVTFADRDGKKQIENGQRKQTEEEDHAAVVCASFNYSQNAIQKLGKSVGDPTSGRRDLELESNTPTNLKLKHVKSVRSLVDSARSKRAESNNQFILESKETDSLDDAHVNSRSFVQNAKKDTLVLSRAAKSSLSDPRVQQLEHRIEMLERELREAAALEVSLYSVIAEHGSSANKVHAPARRLSRFYLHAWKSSKPRRASAARSAVSGLVLVAKACGNDVPRLTFWLSNSVILRAIISLALGDSQLPVSAGPHTETNGGKRMDRGSSLLKWDEFSSRKNTKKLGFPEDVDDWEEPDTFTTALEKVEAWIFSRIIESVWWQTLTPHMQSASKASDERRTVSSRNTYGDQEQANSSVELWKKAFKDACERLCPVRAAGHECGCLPVLARLVMEQCVNRLDVAMFNAILRESADDIPTDPVSDPISDSKVLPIPAGNSSFGAGAQLKNAIGNWSRWLTDLFGIDVDDSFELQTDLDEDDSRECETSSKSFHLLNALSDLMMLPKDMLLNRLIRKEVCPTFGAPLIKKILNDFTPDEFCPDPIPEEVFQALDAEDPLDDEEESIKTFPCSAAPVFYSPPSAAFLASIIGEVGKKSHLRRSGSVLRKSYTSDDELHELDSPLTSITDSLKCSSAPSWKAKENGGPNVVRYELLQEVWRDDD